MYTTIEYAIIHELPVPIQQLDGPINSPLLRDLFERSLSYTAAWLLDTLHVTVCLTRDAYPQPTRLVQYNDRLILVVSMGRWLQILDAVPKHGRVLMESILYHEGILVQKCRQQILILDTGIDDLVVWAGTQYSALRSDNYHIEQPWTRLAFMEEAEYLVKKDLFPTFHEAWEYIVKERI